MKQQLTILIFILAITGSCKSPENAEPTNQIRSAVEDGKLVYYLPAPAHKGSVSVEEALSKRRSQRRYLSHRIPAQHVSQVLWAAYGMSSSNKRTAPSAGARYPLELYLLVGNVSDIEAGVYHYIPEAHKIVRTIEGNLKPALTEAATNQKMIDEAPFCLFYSAIFSRTTEPYGDRGKDRYVCMDLGHSAQNVYLQATALGLGTCAIGQFNDDEVKKVMQLPPQEEPLYIMPVGRFVE